MNVSQASLVFQPLAHRGMQRGVNKMVGAIRPTLGPTPRVVAVDRILDQRMPEILDNGAVIAKRVIQLQDGSEDAGAMLVRDVVEQVGNQAGDGTATAAVIFQRVFNGGIRHLAAGGDVNVLREHLELGAARVEKELIDGAEPVSGFEDLTGLAEALCHDSDMAAIIGEAFDTVGEHGRIEIRAGRDRGMSLEFVEGMYWEQGAVSRSMLTDLGRSRTEFINGAVLISDIEVTDPRQMLPVVERALLDGVRSLLIVVGDISDGALAFLNANNDPDRLTTVVVKVPGWGIHENAAALADLAITTGGSTFVAAAGDTFDTVKLEDFGQARRVWIAERTFGFVGGGGDRRALKVHINGLKNLFDRSDDHIKRDQLIARIGTLLGGSATLWMGGSTEIQIEERVQIAKRTVSAMRGAVLHGVVPGGGAALLACRPDLEAMQHKTSHPDAKAAYRILGDAIAEPFRAIVENAGYDIPEAIARVDQGKAGSGFDVRTGDVADMATAGIVDAAAVQRAAVHASVTSAALALSVEALVRRPHGRPISAQPPAQ